MNTISKILVVFILCFTYVEAKSSQAEEEDRVLVLPIRRQNVDYEIERHYYAGKDLEEWKKYKDQLKPYLSLCNGPQTDSLLCLNPHSFPLPCLRKICAIIPFGDIPNQTKMVQILNLQYKYTDTVKRLVYLLSWGFLHKMGKFDLLDSHTEKLAPIFKDGFGAESINIGIMVEALESVYSAFKEYPEYFDFITDYMNTMSKVQYYFYRSSSMEEQMASFRIEECDTLKEKILEAMQKYELFSGKAGQKPSKENFKRVFSISNYKITPRYTENRGLEFSTIVSYYIDLLKKHGKFDKMTVVQRIKAYKAYEKNSLLLWNMTLEKYCMSLDPSTFLIEK